MRSTGQQLAVDVWSMERGGARGAAAPAPLPPTRHMAVGRGAELFRGSGADAVSPVTVASVGQGGAEQGRVCPADGSRGGGGPVGEGRSEAVGGAAGRQ